MDEVYQYISAILNEARAELDVDCYQNLLVVLSAECDIRGDDNETAG